MAEIPEITVGESEYLARLFKLLPALQSRNYRLYFTGQIISHSGTWLQTVAQSWLVWQLTQSAFLVGVVVAVGNIPSLFFSLIGGVIVDRFYKKHVLIATQVAAMVQAITLGMLTVLNLITVWHVAVLAFVLGIVTAIDSPARNSFIVEMVGKKQLASAIALNSGIFNAARAFGPALAGILIVTVGTGGAFLLNGASYLAVIMALFLIKVPRYEPNHHLKPFSAIKEGLAYTFAHPVIRVFMLVVAVVATFGWSYTTVLPVIADRVFHQGAGGLSNFYVATGLGALLAVFLVSANGGKIAPKYFLFGGNFLYVSSLIAFSLSKNFPLALVFIFLVGLGVLCLFATMNTTIQHLVPNTLRGRVMSIYSLMFLGFLPLGSFFIGWLADTIGAQMAVTISSLFILLFSLWLFFSRHRINREFEKYSLAHGQPTTPIL